MIRFVIYHTAVGNVLQAQAFIDTKAYYSQVPLPNSFDLKDLPKLKKEVIKLLNAEIAKKELTHG
jgi:hypothetical protein